ncbi:MAG: transporter substrate-binding domain-containing protein [Spirochaetia bacterium]
MLHTRGAVCVLILVTLFLSAAAVVSAQSTGSFSDITVGAEPDYPPYSFLDDNGVSTGFSVELFRAVARSMGLSVDLYTDYWDNLRIDLAEGSIDALPLVGRTPEREEVFDFTFPYLSLHGGIVVRSDDDRFAGLEDLHSARIAVMAGDNAEEFLRRREAACDIATFPTFSAAMQDLAAGNSDAVVIQRLVALRLLQEEGLNDLTLVDRPITEFRQDFCFAVTEGNSELLALLNEGLARVVADGTLRRFETVWFSPWSFPAGTSLLVATITTRPLSIWTMRATLPVTT